jgi:hypothetical protein
MGASLQGAAPPVIIAKTRKEGVTMDQVANAIAVIGIYFALMAVLAVSVEAVIGWFKVPPWLQGKPSPSDVLAEVKGWLPADKQAATQARIIALNKSLKAIGEIELLKENATVADIAETIGRATTKYSQQERVRQAVIRLIAIALGIGFAALFQIDTLQILAPLSQPAQTMWQTTLGAGGAHLVGLVLSGLAASAGSSFWHDQSVRLRQIRTASESVRELMEA